MFHVSGSQGVGPTLSQQIKVFTYIYVFPIGAISLENSDQYITFHPKGKHLKFKTDFFFQILYIQ